MKIYKAKDITNLKTTKMSKLKVGDPVEVMDSGLLMMMALMKEMGEEVKPNNIGTVAEIWDDGTILVNFPIGDDDPDEHSQAVPYPAHLVRLRSTSAEG